MPRRLAVLLAISCLAAASLGAQHIREHVRGTRPDRSTITESQAADLTLTLSAVELRPVQTWVRTAGTIDGTGRVLKAVLSAADAVLVKAGQRARAFPPSSKSSMYQARVTRVAPVGAGVSVDIELVAPPRQNATLYVVEIVTEQGPYLSVPNEAIIEEGNRQVVYVQRGQGQYVPQDIHTGVQGELYTQVMDGVKEGDQVVTFGSFFIDAEHKLKATDQNPAER